MRLAAWCALAAAAAAATAALGHAQAQPLHRRQHAAARTTQRAPPPAAAPDNKSEAAPSSLLDAVMQLAVDVSRLAMELHRRGGSQTVTAQRLNTPHDDSLLLTFHRTAEAAAALLSPEGQISQVMSVLASQATTINKREEMGGRSMDYESSAEASFSEPLPLTFRPLPPPVVPKVVPIVLPLTHVAESSSSAVIDKVRHEKAQGSHPVGAGGEKNKKKKKKGEVSERSSEDGKLSSRTVVAVVADGESDDPYGLRILLRFLEAVHKVVDVVKTLVGHLGGLRSGVARRGGDREGDVADMRPTQSRFEKEVVDRVASMLMDHEHAMGAQPTKRAHHKVPSR